MEDTRMDLTQLEENSVRNMPEEVSSSSVILAEDLPAAGPPEEQSDFEGGPDLEGDAAAELDLLGEDDKEVRGCDSNRFQQDESEVAPSAEGASISQVEPNLASQSTNIVPSMPPVQRGALR